MKKTLYFAIALLSAGCTQTEKTDSESNIETIETKTTETLTEEPIRVSRDSVWTAPYSKANAQLTKFYGRWFSVEYPGSFTVSPTKPIQKFDNYKFVETDEATFTSPDGSVEYFVFSPQWGGNPIDYLLEKPNEKTIASSEDKSKSDDPFAVSHHWVTYEDKDGKYTRSYHSLMTESTHHVFGVKYTNRKMYERYKAAYLAFKKSLQQYAD